MTTHMTTCMTIGVAQLDASRTAGVSRMRWLEQQCLLAFKGDVDLLVLPELFISGYNIGPLVETLAETVDGASAKAIAGLAKKYNMAIHYGFAERDKNGFYNAVQCIGPTGEQLGHYRKQVLPPGFEANHFSRGRQLGLFEWHGFNIGMLICYDAEFPEMARQLALAGADIILVPTALGDQWGWVAQQMMPTRGYENGVYFVYANYAGEENKLAYLGASFIGSPLGQVLARAGAEETLLIAKVQLEDVKAAQQRLPYLLDCQDL
mgnify:CR=1 FL=1